MFKKKKIGKKEAIAFDAAFPEATKKNIKQFVIGASILFGIPNTAPKELDKDIDVLEATQKDMKDDITIAIASLDDIEREERTTIGASMNETEETLKAIDKATNTKTDRIAKRTKAKVKKLQDKIKTAEGTAERKTLSIDLGATDARLTVLRKENKNQQQAEEKAKNATADVRAMISALQATVDKQGKQIATLGIIKERFTFNK